LRFQHITKLTCGARSTSLGLRHIAAKRPPQRQVSKTLCAIRMPDFIVFKEKLLKK